MSAEASPHAEHFESLPEQSLSPAIPDEHVAMYFTGNNAAKLVLWLALESFPASYNIKPKAISERIKDMQAGADGWNIIPSKLLGYCHDSLAPAKLIRYGSPEAEKAIQQKKYNSKEEYDKGLRLSGLGRALGPMVAGPLLSFELKTLEENTDKNNKRLPLRLAMGKAYRTNEKIKGVPTRFEIYDALLQNPEGLALKDLLEHTDVGHSTLLGVVQELCNIGLLHNEDYHSENRIFTVTDQVNAMDTSQFQETVLAAIQALRCFYVEGLQQVSAKRIFDKAALLRPNISRQDIGTTFWKWLKKSNRRELIPEVRVSNHRRTLSHITIAPEYRQYLEELSLIKRMLVEDSPEAQVWREEAGAQAKTITDDPERVALLTSSAKTTAANVGSTNNEEWARKLRHLIPPEGINATELHQKVVDNFGKYVHYASFIDRLPQLPDVGVMTNPGAGKRGHTQGYIIKNHTFSKKWTEQAACSDLSPAFFSPLAGPGPVHPKVERQVELAKQICQGCPVRLPCLRKAIDTKEQHEIRGGVWFRNREELPKALTGSILRLVHVQDGGEWLDEKPVSGDKADGADAA